MFEWYPQFRRMLLVWMSLDVNVFFAFSSNILSGYHFINSDIRVLLFSKIDFRLDFYLSYDVASGSEITPCNRIDKPLVVYRFTGNVTTSITTLRT